MNAIFYSRDELLSFGFTQVGENVRVSRDARFFEVSGSLGNDVRIDAFAVLTGFIQLGQRVHISPFCFLNGTGGGITMGDRSGVSSHVSIFTKSDDYQSPLSAAPKLTGRVHIGEDAILGAGCAVLPLVSIGSGCKVGAGCVVGQDLPAGSRVVSRGVGLVPI